MNKTMLITGSSSGLGLALVKHFISLGWEIIGIARREISLPNYTHYSVDISDSEALKNTFDIIKSKHTIDVLINNAGVFAMKSLENHTEFDIDNIINTNLLGTIKVTKHALSIMKNSSKIIFINSVAGLEELDNQSIYCSSKFGLTAFAGILGKELRDRKIKVSSIHPGGINTPLWETNTYPLGDAKEAMDPHAVIEIIDLIIRIKFI
jgi:NAD(P)-dependent dehydrogenase (short-subunit alcohol dehydrogenase family)